MKPLRTIVLLLSTLAVASYTTYYVLNKESLINEGQLVLFELAPVDPRSLLQGDYMSLDYAIVRELPPREEFRRGYLVFTVDSKNIAHFVRGQADPTPLSASEHVISFGRRGAGARFPGRAKIGSDSYFFQEGEAAKFTRARYGGMRVDDRGQAVLVGLYDTDAQPIY